MENGKQQQVTWVEVQSELAVELMPVDEQAKHYTGDECWCGCRVSRVLCGSCRKSVTVFIHLPEAGLKCSATVTVLEQQVHRTIAGGRRNGQS